MAFDKSEWVPLTGLGRMVQAGEIKSIDEILTSGKPIKEPEIVDAFLPDLVDEVLDINMVQRMTDSGRRVKFRAVVVVGNRDVVDCVRGRILALAEQLNCETADAAQSEPGRHRSVLVRDQSE